MTWGELTQFLLIVRSPVVQSVVQRMSYPTDSLDFSKPWQFSDVVLVVEGDRFHVHRNILGMWSEVFTTMFTSEFKEKTARDVPLPGKISSQIKEMLLVIYPTSAKPINQENYGFLLDLAKEYMMANLTRKCEMFLMNVLEKFPHGPTRNALGCLDILGTAHHYGLGVLESACIEKAKGLSLNSLRRDGWKIPIATREVILQGRIQMLEERARHCGECCQYVFPEFIR